MKIMEKKLISYSTRAKKYKNTKEKMYYDEIQYVRKKIDKKIYNTGKKD